MPAGCWNIVAGTEWRIERSCLRTAKYLQTVFCRWVRITRSASMKIPRSRTDWTGLIGVPALQVFLNWLTLIAAGRCRLLVCTGMTNTFSVKSTRVGGRPPNYKYVLYIFGWRCDNRWRLMETRRRLRVNTSQRGRQLQQPRRLCVVLTVQRSTLSAWRSMQCINSRSTQQPASDRSSNNRNYYSRTCSSSSSSYPLLAQPWDLSLRWLAAPTWQPASRPSNNNNWVWWTWTVAAFTDGWHRWAHWPPGDQCALFRWTGWTFGHDNSTADTGVCIDISPHRTHHMDAAYCYWHCTLRGQCVWVDRVCVCWAHGRAVQNGRTDWGTVWGQTHVGQRNHVLDGDAHWRHMVRILLNNSYAVAMRPRAKSLWPLVVFI